MNLVVNMALLITNDVPLPEVAQKSVIRFLSCAIFFSYGQLEGRHVPALHSCLFMLTQP
jgi:hypothetical protein